MNKAFNQAELLEDIDDDMGLLTELYEMFQAGAPRLIQLIKDGLNTNNATAIWQNAHALKSMVGNFCADVAHATAYKVELAGREERFDDVRQFLPVLETEVARLILALDDLIKRD